MRKQLVLIAGAVLTVISLRTAAPQAPAATAAIGAPPTAQVRTETFYLKNGNVLTGEVLKERPMP